MRRGDWYVIAGYPVALALTALLVGCATRLEMPKEVRVAVPVACIAPADRPAKPTLMADGDILALDTYRATWALWGERLELLGYAAKLEAVVEGCSRIPSVK